MDVQSFEVRLSRTTTLPILPSVVTEIMSLNDDGNLGVREYERIINKDAALTAKILRTANSSYFGGNGNITTLQRALGQLGINNIRSICIAVAFQSSLVLKGLDKRFNVATYWQHSLAVAFGAKLLACLAHYPSPDEAFIAGILHDIGKLAICMIVPAEARLIHDLIEQHKLNYYDAETKVMKLTHQEVGRLAAAQWGIPDIYLRPISEHHTPTVEAELDPLTCFVHVADVFAYEIGLGCGLTPGIAEIDMTVLMNLGVVEAQFESLKMAIAKEVSRMSMQAGV